MILDRLIQDSIVLANGAVHFIKNKRGGFWGTMAIKFDLNTDYDWVEGDFLIAILSKIGFCSYWIQLI